MRISARERSVGLGWVIGLACPGCLQQGQSERVQDGQRAAFMARRAHCFFASSGPVTTQESGSLPPWLYCAPGGTRAQFLVFTVHQSTDRCI